MTQINQYVLSEVNWAIQESYKLAVKLCGITDWSQEPSTTKREVEQYQLEIAKMILNSLHETVSIRKQFGGFE